MLTFICQLPLLSSLTDYICSPTSTVNIVGVIFFLSGKMWLSLMPIKLGSWWIVWQLTFRSSSHHLNWSSLRYEALHLCCKIVSHMLIRRLIPIFHCFCIFAGSAECYTDSRMFCLSLCNLPQTHRFDGSCPPMFSGSWGSHWLIPPKTIPSGSRTG